MDPEILGIILGAIGGAAIGVERQWSGHASGPHEHFAGIRTCTLLGGVSGLGGWMWNQGYENLALAVVCGAIVLILAAYVAVSRRDLDGTTEVATLIVVAAGVLSGLGFWQLSSGVIAVTALLLVEKSRLHKLVESISDVGLRAGFRFALMALVILPLLPEGPYGPRGSIRPQQLWILVLLFSGINYVAYVVRSFVGPKRGYVWAGALGGIISSTSVTLTFSRLSRKKYDGTGLALGVMAACTMLYFRVLVTASILNPEMGASVLLYMLVPGAVGSLAIWWGLQRTGAQMAPEEDGPQNPLQIQSALQMALMFQVVLFLITLAKEYFGDAGLILSGAVLGLTDMDALVISMAQVVGTDQMSTAVAATVVGILSNTALKLGVAATVGTGTFRRLAVGGLAILAVATALPLLWL